MDACLRDHLRVCERRRRCPLARRGRCPRVGIPTVVNLRNATRTFLTGDLVELDGDHGVLRRIPEG